MKTQVEKNRYLAGRLISYTALGGLAGALGEKLFEILELEVIKYLAFFFFLCLSIFLLTLWLGFQWPWMKVASQNLQKSLQGRPAFWQGLFSAALPCSTLYQMVTLSILTKDVYGGLIIGAGSSFLTGLFLWGGAQFGKTLTWNSKPLMLSLRWIVAAIIILNLFIFSAKIWSPESFEKLTPAQRQFLCV